MFGGKTGSNNYIMLEGMAIQINRRLAGRLTNHITHLLRLAKIRIIRADRRSNLSKTLNELNYHIQYFCCFVTILYHLLEC